MMLARYTSVLAVASIMLGALATPGYAGEKFVPTPTLILETRAALGVAPKDVILNGEFAYVLGVNADGASVIEMRHAGSLEMITSKSVDAHVEDIAADPESGMVYAIGHNGENTRFHVMDAKLNPLGATRIKPRVGHPTLTIAAENLVAVSGIQTDFSDGFFAAIDISTPQEPVLREDYFALDARRGVMNGWLGAGYSAIFLNASWDSRLLAIAPGKSYLMSEFSVQTASGSLSEPYAVTAQLGHKPCRNGLPASFLVADMTRSVLSLVDFNESFQSLDMMSFVEFNLAPTRATLDRLEGTYQREPAGLISASCDQAVIFLGSKTSNELVQFARNLDLASLEQVGTIRLPGRPNGIAVDPSGQFALVVSAENRAIMRLGGETGSAPDTRIIGDADVRELQRTLTEIGIPVGSIDGIIGTKTLHAAELAERRFGVKLDPANDPAESVKTLKRALKLK